MGPVLNNFEDAAFLTEDFRFGEKLLNMTSSRPQHMRLPLTTKPRVTQAIWLTRGILMTENLWVESGRWK